MRFLIAGVVVCAASASASQPVMTVSEVASHLAALDGRTVSVRGWLSDPCGGYSCAILPKPAKAAAGLPDGPRLSIAGSTPLESALNANQGREMVLTGVIDACRCSTDRAPDITPISLTPVRPATKDH